MGNDLQTCCTHSPDKDEIILVHRPDPGAAMSSEQVVRGIGLVGEKIPPPLAGGPLGLQHETKLNVLKFNKI